MTRILLFAIVCACSKEPDPKTTSASAGSATPAAAPADHQLHRVETADHLAITGQGIALATLPTMDWIGLPMTGTVDVAIDVQGTSDLSKANGTIHISCTDCRLGDDKTTLKPHFRNARSAAFAGEIEFGHIELPGATIDINIAAGKATILRWEIVSQDIVLKVEGSMTLGKTFADSTIDACLRFGGTPALRDRDPKTYAMLMTTGAPLAGDGMYNIRLADKLGDMKRLGMVCDGSAPPPAERPTLTVDSGSDSAVAPPPDDNKVDPKLATLIAGTVTKKSDTSYEIDHVKWEKLFADPAAMGKGARVVPAVKDGKPVGFKLYAIRPESLWAKLGLMNGDTFVSVAGIALVSADKGIEAYTAVRNAKVGAKVEVAIERRGKPMTLTYTLK